MDRYVFAKNSDGLFLFIDEYSFISSTFLISFTNTHESIRTIGI